MGSAEEGEEKRKEIEGMKCVCVCVCVCVHTCVIIVVILLLYREFYLEDLFDRKVLQ